MGIFALSIFGLVVWEMQKEPNPHQLTFVNSRVDDFVSHHEHSSQESLIVVNQRLFPQEKPQWSLLTLAQGQEIEGLGGSGGVVGIGTIVEEQWVFLMQGENGFDGLLQDLPEELMEPELKNWFTSQTPRPLVLRLGEDSSAPRISFAQEVFNLPWTAGKKFKLTTLPGEGHHTGPSQYSLDFAMPEGEPILAIASGRIIALNDSFSLGGCDERYANQANYLAIQLESGNVVRYLHTQFHSSTDLGIKVGDKILVGQVVAKNGSTGFTCNWSGTGPGPHVHITLEQVCSNNPKMICASLPLNFAEFEGQDPKKLVAYTSANLSLEAREEKRREEQKQQQRQDEEAIFAALDHFGVVYDCVTIKSCDATDLSEWIFLTENARNQLVPPPGSFCLFCTVTKYDAKNVISYKILPIPLIKGEPVEVLAQSVIEAINGDLEETHHAQTKIFLVKESGVWKVDGFEVFCGFITDRAGKVTREINLSGCPVQPPKSGPSR